MVMYFKSGNYYLVLKYGSYDFDIIGLFSLIFAPKTYIKTAHLR